MWYVEWFDVVYKVQTTSPVVYRIEGSVEMKFICIMCCGFCLPFVCAVRAHNKDTFRRNGLGLCVTLLSSNIKLVWIWLHLGTVKRDDRNISNRIKVFIKNVEKILSFFFRNTRTKHFHLYSWVSLFLLFFFHFLLKINRLTNPNWLQCYQMNIWTKWTCNLNAI